LRPCRNGYPPPAGVSYFKENPQEPHENVRKSGIMRLNQATIKRPEDREDSVGDSDVRGCLVTAQANRHKGGGRGD